MNLFLKNILGISSLTAFFCTGLQAASFDSGSNGSDGALIIDGGLGTFVFDPDDFEPVLDPDRDGIYHFTTIEIGPGTSVRLRADVLGHKPVIWLASGNVYIGGELDLSAHYLGNDMPSIPGAGGFSGGGPFSIQDGQGPGGSVASSPRIEPSNDYVNPFLMPLVGASGMGADLEQYSPGESGGGALLIASSGTAIIDGAIYAHSIYGNTNGNVRLVADEISGEGYVGGINVLRLEAFQHTFSGGLNAERVVRAAPGAVFPRSPIKIVFVDGHEPLEQPGANKHTPDVTIANGGATYIEVHCWQIPLGTIIRVVGWNETVGMIEAFTGPLQGTLEESYASCEMVIPPGNTTFMAHALLEP
jgi:hypothetical protein